MTILSRLVWLVCMALLLVTHAAAQQSKKTDKKAEPEMPAPPILEQTPHDELLLKDDSVIQVEAIPFPNRKLPDKPRPGDKLIVHLLDKPDDDYEVAWRDIKQVRLFEQRVLEAAQKLAAAGDFDKAYDYFDYLERNYPKMWNLPEAVQKYLYQDAQNWQRRKQYDYVLALLNQLYQRNSKYPGLNHALGLAVEQVIEARLAADEYQAAQSLLHSFEAKYPNDPQVARLQQRLMGLADAALAKAQTEAAAGHLREAQELCRHGLRAWPRHEAIQTLYAKLHDRYPYVVVGVTQPYLVPDLRLDNWAAQRASRLLQWPLVEFTGFGTEGGNYLCPLGTMEEGDLGLRLTFRLRPEVHWPDGTPVSAFDVSRTLVETSGTNAHQFMPWADYVERVDVSDVYTAAVRFKQPPVHPEALFRTAITPPAHFPPDTALGLFKRGSVVGDRATYLASDADFGRSSKTPKEIVERRFERGRQAIEALRRREISIIDRIAPWEIDHLREQADVIVEPYAVPTVHCLLANPNRPLLANRVFRRALLYGIHRASILDVQILRGRQLPAARLVTAPYPAGYAYNEEVEVRPYEPRVAMMLASVALSEVATEQKQHPGQPTISSEKTAVREVGIGQPSAGPADAAQAFVGEDKKEGASTGSASKGPPCPTLVLAHPADDVARLACRAIERQLNMIKIPIRLVELKPGELATAKGQYDLVYAELQIAEPLVDLARLFGPSGLVPLESPYLRSALGKLADASDWKSAREALLRIHKVVADELPILPLYQLPEYFVRRRTIVGIGPQPASLYQNIDAWQTSPEIPSAE